MKEQNIIKSLASLSDDAAVRVASAVLNAQTPLGRAMNVSLKAMVAHYMFECTGENAAASAKFQEMYGNFVTAAVKEAINQLQDSTVLPLQSYYSELEACEFIGKNPQFFKTRRANGQPVPAYFDSGSGYIYAAEDLAIFFNSLKKQLEPFSQAKLMESGLEELSIAVGTVKKRIDSVRVSRVPKNNLKLRILKWFYRVLIPHHCHA